MNVEGQFDQELQEATDKAIAILSELLEAGVIIGTYRDADGKTQKWSQPWGNEFAVVKIVEVEKQENDVANAMVIGTYCEED